jgi:hypothetical protein
MPIVTPQAGQIGGRSSASGLDLLLRGRAIGGHASRCSQCALSHRMSAFALIAVVP